MKVREIITAKAVKSCHPETNLQEAVKTMKDANCGALPVTDGQNKVIGIVTDRDICLALVHGHALAHTEIPVSYIMERKVHTIKEGEDINEALKQMRTNQVARLPVVDHENKLRGILSIHDLISKTFNGQNNLGKITDQGENMLKTIKAVTEGYLKPKKAEKEENLLEHTL